MKIQLHISYFFSGDGINFGDLTSEITVGGDLEATRRTLEVSQNVITGARQLVREKNNLAENHPVVIIAISPLTFTF